MDVSAMQSVLSDHGFDDASDARQLEVLNSSYWDLCGREPWPFLEKTATLDFDDDTGTPGTSDEWPTDFRAALSMVVTAGSGLSGLGQKVKYMRYDDFLQRYGTDATSGIPTVWYMIGYTAHFYPVPPTDTVITMLYLQQPAALADATLEAAVVVPVPFHRVIVDGALFRLYAMEDDTDIAPTFESYFERGLVNMREYVWRRQYADNDIVHPVDADDVELDIGWGNWVN